VRARTTASANRARPTPSARPVVAVISVIRESIEDLSTSLMSKGRAREVTPPKYLKICTLA